MVARPDHDDVRRLPAGHRAVRDDLLHGRRVPRLRHQVGRHRGLAVHVRIAHDRQRDLLATVQREAQNASRRLVRRHGRVAHRPDRVLENVQGRRPAAQRLRTDRRVRPVHVLRPGGHAAVALVVGQ